jgi:hypothetical protein
MPRTALVHFKEDVARARAIVAHADPLPLTTDAELLLRGDLFRSAWMFAVGALDAYFCDAYTDVVAATIISKSRHPAMTLPSFFNRIEFPVRAILESYSRNTNWRWRMAAREMMARENVLKLDRIRELFNGFCRDGHKLYSDVTDAWIVHPDARRRLFGTTAADYLALSPAGKDAARKAARRQMEKRFFEEDSPRSIFQRRHDCIHNCDRPRMTPQPLEKAGTVIKVIEDVEFLVDRCDEHITVEFRHFLSANGCPPTIITQAGY